METAFIVAILLPSR